MRLHLSTVLLKPQLGLQAGSSARRESGCGRQCTEPVCDSVVCWLEMSRIRCAAKQRNVPRTEKPRSHQIVQMWFHALPIGAPSSKSKSISNSLGTFPKTAWNPPQATPDLPEILDWRIDPIAAALGKIGARI